MRDLNGRPALLLPDYDEKLRVLGLKSSIPKPADSGLSSTARPWLSQLPFSDPLKLWYPPWRIDAHPSTRSILSFAIDWCFIVASLISLFSIAAFLLCH